MISPLKKRPVHKTALTTPLAGVQIEALKKSSGLPGYAWYMEMGLGKTLTALAEFDQLAVERTATRMIVVCPNSFKGGWQAEIVKHGFSFNTMVWTASRKMQAYAWAVDGNKPISQGGFSKPPVLIINYESIRADKKTHTSPGLEMLKLFCADKDVMLVIDESIAMKDPRAAQTKALKKLVLWPQIKRVRLLSGRPSTQGPHDLWAQLHSIMAVRESFFQFRNTYCRMGGYQGKEVLGSRNEQELADRMAGYVFKALKVDYLPGLPAQSYTERAYSLGPLKRHYDEMEQLFLTQVRKMPDERVMAKIVLDQYGKLQQIQCGFIHREDAGEALPLCTDAENPRLQLLLKTLETEISGKVAIVYVHRYVGDQLARVLKDEHPAWIKGGMKKEEIDQQKDLFNNDPACRVILLQAKASKFGHTLLGDQNGLGDHCSTMIFYQNSYSLDDRTQVEARIHRMGQKNACLYLDFVGSDMDRHVIGALQRKQSIYDAVMEKVR